MWRRVDLIWIVALAALGLAAAWSILSAGLADRLAGSNPGAALAWRGNDDLALVGMAERELGAGRMASAEAYARRALAADPLQVPALRVLGLTAARRGDVGRARAFMTAAGARNHRDPALQVWLLNDAAARGNYDEAYARADALARAEPDLTRRLFPTMMSMAMRPAGLDALAHRLALEPPWRGGFLNNWIRLAPSADGPISLMDELAVLGSPATPMEKAVIQARLVRDGRFQQAFVLWAQDLPRDQLNNLADVNDSGFDGVPADGPFTWAIERQARAVADFETAPGRPGRALHLMFDGRPTPQVIVRQLLVLPPGPRVLTGEVRADRFEALEGLSWSIRCNGEGRQVVAEATPITTSTGWRRFTVAFDVPAAACEGQWLSLSVLGQSAGARRVSGDVWFDNITVQR